jgi:hypothetical protein
VRHATVVLLMRRCRQNLEPEHFQELPEKLRAEMPPGMPEKILPTRRQTTDRRSLQFRIKFIDNNQSLRFFASESRIHGT